MRSCQSCGRRRREISSATCPSITSAPTLSKRVSHGLAFNLDASRYRLPEEPGVHHITCPQIAHLARPRSMYVRVARVVVAVDKRRRLERVVATGIEQGLGYNRLVL